MIKYMLDTNIAIYVIKHKPIQVLDQFNRCADQMCNGQVKQDSYLGSLS